MPLLAHWLKAGFGFCRLLEIAGGILIFYLSARLLHRLTDDRVAAFWGTMVVACIFAGTTSFVEFRGMFDGVAILLLVAAVFFKNPLLIGLCVFAGAWTDERALVASSLVMLYHLQSAPLHLNTAVRRFFSGPCVATFLAWLAYFAGRYYLVERLGLNADSGGVGFSVLANQLNNLPMGIWTGLEGAWILVVLGMIGLWLRKDYLVLGLQGLAVTAVIVVAMSVMDITRSMAYILPVLFLSVKQLNETETKQTVRSLLFTAFLVSFLWPSYYAGGKEAIWWHSPPLPIQIIRELSK
jgi:hypothetical protein